MLSLAQDILYKTAINSTDWRYGYHFINEELQQKFPDHAKIAKMIKIYGSPEMFFEDFSNTQKTGIKPEGFKTIVKNEARLPPFIANPLWITLERKNKESILMFCKMGVRLQGFIDCQHPRMEEGAWFLEMVVMFEQTGLSDIEDATLLYWLKRTASFQKWLAKDNILRQETSFKKLQKGLRKIGAMKSADFLVIEVAQKKYLTELTWALTEQESWQARDIEGKTLLFYFFTDDKDTFYRLRDQSLLIEKMLQMIDINDIDLKGRCILYYAIAALAELKNSISVNKHQISVNTVAQLYVMIDNIRYLIELGADPMIKDNKGMTSARLARLAKVASTHPLLAFHSERDAMLENMAKRKSK